MQSASKVDKRRGSGQVCATDMFLVFSHSKQKKSTYSYELPYLRNAVIQSTFMMLCKALTITKMGKAKKSTHLPGS